MLQVAHPYTRALFWSYPQNSKYERVEGFTALQQEVCELSAGDSNRFRMRVRHTAADSNSSGTCILQLYGSVLGFAN